MSGAEPEAGLDVITALEGRLKAAVSLRSRGERRWVLALKLVYDGHPAGDLSFNLEGYDASEAQDVARNVARHPQLMREIDEYLWGESD